MTRYYIDTINSLGADDSGTGTEGDPFKSYYAARTAIAAGGNTFYCRGIYVRRKGASGRTVSSPGPNTIFHGYDPANPAQWWCGSRIPSVAESGPSWTETSGGSTVWSSALGFTHGHVSNGTRRLCWYYDPATKVPPRQLQYMATQALVAATDNSFWFDSDTNTLWVNLQAGETPDGRIVQPYGSSAFSDGWGDSFGGGWMTGRSGLIFHKFGYLYCGTRPWDYGGPLQVGNDCHNIEFRRCWLGFTHGTDAVIRPVGRASALVMDECKLQAGGIGILYTYEGTPANGPVRGKPGHIMTLLRLTRSLLTDSGVTHRGGNDNHAIGSQGSSSHWECGGNIITQTGRAIVMWAGNYGGGEKLDYLRIVGNVIKESVTGYPGTYDLSHVQISWENGDTNSDQSGSVVEANHVDGNVTSISPDYGKSSARADYAIGGIRTARQLAANVVPVRGNIVRNASASYMDQNGTGDAELGWDVQHNTSAKVRAVNGIGYHTYRFNAGVKPGIVELNHMTFLGAVRSYKDWANIHASAAAYHTAVPQFLTAFVEDI